jgi:hypothetical protein
VKHRHRILPGYAGGEYSEGNTIEVSVTQHAMWHFANWQLWGNKQDWLAWKGLSGQILVSEVNSKKSSIAGSNTVKKCRERGTGIYNPEYRASEEWVNQKASNGKKTGSQNGKVRCKPVRCITTGVVFGSSHEASRATGAKQSHISECCLKKRKTAGKLQWEYLDGDRTS